MKNMNMFRSLKQGDNDLLSSCRYLLDFFKVNHTRTALMSLLERHPEYPSLLAVKDVLLEYGVASVAIRKGRHGYAELEAPFVCAIQREDWGRASFTVVSRADRETITYLDPLERSERTISVPAFEQMDKDIVLLLDDSGKKHEVNHEQNRKAERTGRFIARLPLYLTGLAILFAGSFLLAGHPPGIGLVGAVFLLGGLGGLLISTLLLWHEVDAHNPFVREVCGALGRRSNCHAVLSSAGASFLGVSWSVWGFGYFATFFMGQLLFADQSAYIGLWSVVSLVVSPYILYSLYYQWKVVGQWCPLCLGIQGVLFVHAMVAAAFFATGNTVDIGWYPICSISVLGLASLFLTYYAVPLVKQARDGSSYEKRWKKLRYHPDIFRALLAKSSPVTISPEGLGIVVGNPDAGHEIIKVCNPYCSPCSRAHPVLEHIVKHNKDVKLRIIFTASGEEDDIKTAPVAHLLAIEQKLGSAEVHRALDEWYLAERKDYGAFAGIYPMNGELKQQREKINAMRVWCDWMKVRATPTIFIDGYELPESYHIGELKNFF